MEIGRQGESLNDEMVRHFDQCLGCMACVTACPSGVQYGKLIEATRQQVERRYPRSRRDRAFRALIFSLFPYPTAPPHAPRASASTSARAWTPWSAGRAERPAASQAAVGHGALAPGRRRA